ncbi:MAG: twin-arginine translocase TatA/TatE family subunit [bacterium]
MGIGTQEILLLLFFALIFFGANKIPGIARGLGKGIAEFRRAARDIQDEINRSVNDEPGRPERPKEIPGEGPERMAGGPSPETSMRPPRETSPEDGPAEEDQKKKEEEGGGEHPEEA